MKSVNPHEEKNWIMQYQKEISNQNSIKKEIDGVLKFLESIIKYNLVVVFSNHDDFLTRFIINADVKKNIKNAIEFIDYSKALLEGKAPNGVLPYIINQKFPQIKCLGIDDSHKVKGWELANHGMTGFRGSRGNINFYKSLNVKMVVGHFHSVARLDGCVQVGTNSQLRLGYNHSASDWVHGDVIIHASDAKCQHILYLGPNKEFTTFK
jgi:hypothetical protein